MAGISIGTLCDNMTQETMAFVEKDVDLDHNTVLDEAELEKFMKDTEAAQASLPPPTGDKFEIPPEPLRIRLGVGAAMGGLADQTPGLDKIKVLDLRVQLRKQYEELVTAATKLSPGSGLNDALAVIMALGTLPDEGVAYIREAIAQNK